MPPGGFGMPSAGSSFLDLEAFGATPTRSKCSWAASGALQEMAAAQQSGSGNGVGDLWEEMGRM